LKEEETDKKRIRNSGKEICCKEAFWKTDKEEDIVNTDFIEMCRDDKWMKLAQDRLQRWSLLLALQNL